MAVMEGGDMTCPHCGGRTPIRFDIADARSRTFTEDCAVCGRLIVCVLMVMFSNDIGLSLLTVENLRLAIQQDDSPAHHLPQALAVLREHPLAKGDLYQGDLLSAVLTREPEVWSASPGLARDLRVIVSALVDLPVDIRREAERFLASGNRRR